MPVKLDHHHRVTLLKIFAHPINHNVKWRDVLSLLSRFGDVRETHRGNWAVTVEGETTSFGSTRLRELSEDQLVKVRGFLRSAGVDPRSFQAA